MKVTTRELRRSAEEGNVSCIAQFYLLPIDHKFHRLETIQENLMGICSRLGNSPLTVRSHRYESRYDLAHAEHLVDQIVNFVQPCDGEWHLDLMALGDTALLLSVSAKGENQAQVHATKLFAEIDAKLGTVCQALTAIIGSDLLHKTCIDTACNEPKMIAYRDLDGNAFTYGHLYREARMLANGLIDHGLKQGERVGLYFHQEVDYVICSLAVLMAGGCFVPLDKDTPSLRLRYLLEDAEIALLLSDGHYELNLHMFTRPWVELKSTQEQALPLVSAQDPAYVIYTSGSTGYPKGVVVSHGNICALLRAAMFSTGISAKATWSACHSISFDFNIWEVWGSLSSQGAIIALPKAVARQPSEFYRAIKAHGVTILSQTPSSFYRILSDIVADQASIERVIFGGEKLDKYALLPLFNSSQSGSASYYDLYGITETTVHVTCKKIERSDCVENSNSVGFALPGWVVRVVGESSRVLKDGEIGEIHVGGAGVAIGYINNPELTADKFTSADVTDLSDNKRWYLTGDLGRINRFGELEILGRKDDQVSINGHRIELGEINQNLEVHDDVLRCATIKATLSDAPCLVSFVVSESTATEHNLLSFLRMRVPAYMLPACIVHVDEIPLTDNGKIDTEALRSKLLDGIHLTQSHDHKDIASIWAEVLDVDVHSQDNFFMIGGNSITAIQLITRIETLTGYPVTLADLYSHPILGQFNTLVKEKYNGK